MYGTHFKPPQCTLHNTTVTIENIHIDKYLHPQQTCQATLPTEWASRITMTNDSWNYYYYYYYSTTHNHIAHPSLEKIQFHLQIHFGLLGMAILLIVTGFFMCSTVFFWHTHQIRYHMGIMSQLNQSKAVVCNERANKKVMIFQWHPVHHKEFHTNERCKKPNNFKKIVVNIQGSRRRHLNRVLNSLRGTATRIKYCEQIGSTTYSLCHLAMKRGLNKNYTAIFTRRRAQESVWAHNSG